jgi:hypothetical protein
MFDSIMELAITLRPKKHFLAASPLRGDWSQESGVRSQESGVRSQESGVRSQEIKESGVRRRFENFFAIS